jgi:hypothetical protein
MIGSNVYILDFERLIKLALPTFLRQVKRLAYLNAVLTPIKNHYNAFVLYKDDAIYRVSHNGSIVLLQKVLNDKFDAVERRIYIKNVERIDGLRLYPEASSREVGVYSPAKKALRPAFNNSDGSDFIIHIPIEYQYANEVLLNKFLIKLRAQVDYYKLYAKKYKIEWIE